MRAPGAAGPGVRPRILAGLGRPVLLLLAAGCVQVRPRPDYEEARRLVGQSTGRQEVFDPLAPLLEREEVEAILADGLALDEALRLALVNSRELQAEFLAIGVARADWVQSGLLSNPVLDLRLPFTGSGGTLEGSLGFELLELWRLPVRRESAQGALDATVLRVARRAGERLAEARSAYFAAVAAEELARVAEEHLALAERSFGAVQELRRSGAADAFDESLARSPLLAAQLALRSARLEAATSRRELAKRLSLELPVSDLRLTDPLPEPSEPGLEAEALVRLAQESRLDLRAMARAIEALEARVRLERRRAWGNASAGPSVERLEGDDASLGGSFGVTLPLFDQNQAQVSRAELELEQLHKAREALRVAIAQDLRTALDRASTAALNLRFQRDELLPEAQRGMELARDSHAAGRATLFVLLDAQRRLLEAREGLVLQRLQAATAAADLEQVLGRVLPSLAERQ